MVKKVSIGYTVHWPGKDAFKMYTNWDDLERDQHLGYLIVERDLEFGEMLLKDGRLIKTNKLVRFVDA